MSKITIDLSGEDSEYLKGLEKGDSLSLQSVSGTVESNDGKTLVASVEEVTCEDEGEEDDEGEDMKEGAPMEGKGMMMKHTPIAVIAIGGKAK